MLYLDKVKLPVPVRFRKKNGESHVMKLPVFQMFPVSGIEIENCIILTPLWLMELPTLINSFQISGLLGSNFQVHSNF